MYTDRQLDRLLGKLSRFEKTLEPLMFEKIGEIEVMQYPTEKSYDAVPEDSCFVPCKKGDAWGGEWSYCWYKGSYTVPEEYDGENFYVYPKIGGYEAMLWVNGVPHGIFADKINIGSHGNHYCDRIKTAGKAGERIDIALEYYAHHYVIGTQPFDRDPESSYQYTFEEVGICLKNEEICDFYFDLKTINQMVRVLPWNSFRRAGLVKALVKVHEMLFYDYENAQKEDFYAALRKAAPLLKEQLARKNAESAPTAGIIGHSHMDTAWLWHQGETLKKCARTYANQMNLMEQYPEYLFVQSSTYHSEMIKEHYPALFEQIKERVKEGRYEPNGGVYIECDCNIPSGEMMVRQFLYGQHFTQENFGYRSDCFWLPDTFGYSVSLPQIMKGCGIRYFLTTKIDWNDTNTFPYDTFYWKGLDGSKVLVHFNKSHLWPDAATVMDGIVNSPDHGIKEKPVSNMRLFSYGFGDGGGGPQFEMIEMARRIRDTEGIPKTEHMTVSSFMKRLEESIEYPSTYSGELYLELHRGTLTNNHTIKRNNRLAETALHNLEYALVREGLASDSEARQEVSRALFRTALKNQFHDILPGTCIPRAHDEAIQEMTELIGRANSEVEAIGARWAAKAEEAQGITVSVMNTLSFARREVIYLDYKEGYVVEGAYPQQVVEDLLGNKKLAVMGVEIPAFSTVALKLVPGEIKAGSAFTLQGNVLAAPLEKITFNEKGYLESYIDLEENRELRGEGHALNTLLVGEEVSSAWDNWDVDADFECRLKDGARLLERKVVADGMVEFRIRSTYQLTAKSTLTQDMVVSADSKAVRFDTLMDWQDEHCFLKAAFDTTVFTDVARQEVQFGYIKRNTTRNNSEEKAKFEVSNHKYTDLSESRYGAAVLNDCKYGISVEDSKMHLSLHKGGNRPDYRGDKGKHFCSYAFLPHCGGFAADNVIQPACCFNVKPVLLKGEIIQDSLLEVSAGHILADTIKPAESGEKAYVVRLYEAEGAGAEAKIQFHTAVKKVELTNLLEEPEAAQALSWQPEKQELTLRFRPFEIKTVKVYY